MALFFALAQLPLWLLLTLSSAAVVFGDFAAKQWSVEKTGLWLLLAFAGYLGASFFYLPTLVKHSLVTTSVAWSILSIAGFLIVGLLIFHEKLSPLQSVGVVLGIAALLIISLAEK